MIKIKHCKNMLLKNGFTNEDIKLLNPNKAFIIFFKLLEMGVTL